MIEKKLTFASWVLGTKFVRHVAPNITALGNIAVSET